MSSLKIIPEERKKISPSITESVYSATSSGKLPPTLNRRKILHPLLNSTNMTASASLSITSRNDRRNITGRVLSAKEHRMKQLQNQLTDAQYHLNELYRENRLLKSIQKRQDSALQRYENANGDIPKLINSHNEELRSLQVRYKQVKLQFREVSQKIKEKDNELFKLTEDHKRLLELSKDANLGERESLRNQVKELTEKVQKQNETISSLQRRLMLEEKAHKRQLHLEMTKHKETQQQLTNALSHSNQLSSVIEMKEKLIAGSNTQRKLFPKIGVHNSNLKPNTMNLHEAQKYKQHPILPTYSPKENISTDASLDSNLKFSSSSTFSVVGKSLQHENESSNQSSDKIDIQQSTHRTIAQNERDHPSSNIHYRNNTDLDLAEAIHVGIPNMSISESDTEPPRSSDDDVRERVENMKRHIRKSHRNEADVSFDDVKSMIQMENKRISRGTLSITSDDSSNGQLTIRQIEKSLSRSVSKQSEGKTNTKSLLMDLENTDFNGVFNNINNEDKHVDQIENNALHSNRRTSEISILNEYMSRRSSNDDSDNRCLDSQYLNKKSPEMNNNSVGMKETKSDLDDEKKMKLLAALKAIDRGEEQGLLFNTSKRNSVTPRKYNQ